MFLAYTVEVLKDFEVQVNGNKANQLQTKITRQRELEKSIEDAEDMFILHKSISQERFDSIVNRLSKELMIINTEIEVLSSGNDSIKQYWIGIIGKS